MLDIITDTEAEVGILRKNCEDSRADDDRWSHLEWSGASFLTGTAPIPLWSM